MGRLQAPVRFGVPGFFVSWQGLPLHVRRRLQSGRTSARRLPSATKGAGARVRLKQRRRAESRGPTPLHVPQCCVRPAKKKRTTIVEKATFFRAFSKKNCSKTCTIPPPYLANAIAGTASIAILPRNRAIRSECVLWISHGRKELHAAGPRAYRGESLPPRVEGNG